MGKPLSISLLSALPHSLADVEASACDPRNDYVVNQLLKYHSPKDIWRLVGPHLETAAESLFEWCDKNGIAVVRKATLEKLQVAAATTDIVIVLAHWKGALVRWTDLTAPVSQLIPCIQLCRSKGILGLKAAPVNDDESDDETRSKLANCLTLAIGRWPKWLDLGLQPGQRAVVSNFYACSRARERIDEIFGKNILPGARIELDDGLWRPVDIADCLPLGWGGICDFACCTSTYLSEVVKCHHRNAIFRADSRILRPEMVIRATRSVLEKVHSGARDYISAAYEANEQYGDL
ncbi:hypothetical protein ACVIWV_007708 [Bradyrhizobium diazoefficiens]